MLTVPTIISSILYLFIIYSESQIGRYIVKPLTTILIIGVSTESDQVRNNAKLLGLIFSLFGDIFLMFPGEEYFMLGLSSFLTAHIFYIYMFYNTKKRNQPSLLAGLLSIAALYYSFLFKHIFSEGGAFLSGAVLVYVVVITFMVYYALLNDNAYLSLGVVCFFVSDATLALGEFIVKSSDSKLEYIVMITYHIAQFSIARYY